MVVTLRVWAILVSISNDGCILLEHHLETVEGSLPSCSASHLPVFFCSAKTTFSLFKSFILLQFIGVFRKFNTRRVENKINSFIFYPEPQFKLSEVNTTTPQLYLPPMKRLHCLFASYFDANKQKLDFKGIRQSVNSKFIPEREKKRTDKAVIETPQI